MYRRMIVSGVIALGALLGPKSASATTYAVDCGTNGPASVLQSQIDAIGSARGNTIAVTGTCVGDVTVMRADTLTVSNLSLAGTLGLYSSVMVSISNLHLTGELAVFNTRQATLSDAVINGTTTVNHGTFASFPGLTMSSSGGQDPNFSCVGESECNLSQVNLSGSGKSVGSVGLLAGSSSRLNVNGGSISGFDIGVQAWNNAIIFMFPDCAGLKIGSNLSTGIYTTDGGIVKVEGLSAADADASGCKGPIYGSIGNNGRFGVLADGGGNAYLYLTNIGGHSVDNILVQHGSTVRVRSSTIDAASSGRSARVARQAHLYFDEQGNGPAASSALAGPVCTGASSSVDTDNSSTVITTTTTCP